MNDAYLPPLPLEKWEATKDTLHLWAQIIGKTRLALMPMRNHWWNVTLYPSARGLTTRRMPVDAHNLEIEIDLVDHRVWARTTESDASFELHHGLAVAEFHERLLDTLDRLDLRVDIRAEPFGVPMTPVSRRPRPRQLRHRGRRPIPGVLQWSADVLEEFAGWYCGKRSPVRLFWHGLDLATSRFSGRRADARSDVDAVTAEAYSHEIISFGFWAGDKNNPYPAYYSYMLDAAPEPKELPNMALCPAEVQWAAQPNGSLAILPYEDVRSARDPKSTLLDFLQSAYEAGASLAGWDLADTATRWCPVPFDRLTHLSRPTATAARDS